MTGVAAFSPFVSHQGMTVVGRKYALTFSVSNQGSSDWERQESASKGCLVNNYLIIR
jgi:hypothetical protein